MQRRRAERVVWPRESYASRIPAVGGCADRFTGCTKCSDGAKSFLVCLVQSTQPVCTAPPDRFRSTIREHVALKGWMTQQLWMCLWRAARLSRAPRSAPTGRLRELRHPRPPVVSGAPSTHANASDCWATSHRSRPASRTDPPSPHARHPDHRCQTHPAVDARSPRHRSACAARPEGGARGRLRPGHRAGPRANGTSQ